MMHNKYIGKSINLDSNNGMLKVMAILVVVVVVVVVMISSVST
jgi:hypothetical protein